MLVSFFLYLFCGIASTFLSMFGTADTALLSNVSGAVSSASGYLAAINSLVPVSTLLVIVGLFLALEGFIIVVKIINWIIRKIPTIS